jgi:hypothetical protein
VARLDARIVGAGGAAAQMVGIRCTTVVPGKLKAEGADQVLSGL